MPEKKSLYELPVARTQAPRRGIRVRTIKMLAPVCASCQERNLRNWWERCQHNPYFSPSPRRISVPVLACVVCGEEVSPGTAFHCDQTNFEVRGSKETVQTEMVANTREVPVDEGNLSGRAVERARSKGWKMPEELGIAPMCQFQGCWNPNPKVRTSWGDYCSEVEARIIGHGQTGEAVEVHSQRKRNQQLMEVSL